MAYYVQLLGSDTPNGYGGCCYYGPLDHPALRESTTTAATTTAAAGSSPPRGETPEISGHIYAADAEASVSASRFASSLNACGDDAPQKRSSTAEAAAAAVSSQWNWSAYLRAKPPQWPRSGPLHRATLLNPRPPSSSLLPPDKWTTTPAPHVTSETGLSGSEGYIFFNCPEGTQRFSSEANIKLKKVRGFFFTRWSSTGAAVTPPLSRNASYFVKDAHQRGATHDTVAEIVDARTAEMPVGAASAVMGLPGMLFTINDAGVRHATFFGPSAVLDDAPHAASIHDTGPIGARDSDGGEPRSSLSEHASAHASGLRDAQKLAVECTVGSVVTVGGSRIASTRPSAGLRDFLRALRFHYFQYRPMVFRQLHGVVRSTTSPAVIGGGGGSDDAITNSSAPEGNNQVHFMETVGEPTMLCVTPKDNPLADVSPFIHITVPLSAQSLLVGFRVSGGCRRGGGEGTAAASAASDAMMSHSPLASPSIVSDDQRERHPPRSVKFAARTGGGKRAEGADAAAPTAFFTAPTSHDVVLGYAIIVAPGSSFDVAKARSLGVRSGPKYGQLKLGMPVEADVDPDMAGTSAALRPSSQSATVSSETISDPPPAPTRHWVHPHQVMRPTAATRHAYISLVLDGDRPEDVREALTRLLGGNAVSDSEVPPASGCSAACEGTQEGSSACRACAVDGHGSGVLQRLLREHFPHLAYYYEDEEDVMVPGTSAAPSPSQKPRLVRRLRQLTLRHVVHVQPTSYFLQFDRRCGRGTLLCSPVTHEEKLAVQSMTSPAPHYSINASNVYSAYNMFIFADVTARSSSRDHHHHHHQDRGVCRAANEGGGSTLGRRIETGSATVAVSGTSSLPQRSPVGSQAAVQLSLAPSLSFTLHDMTDHTEEDAEVGEKRRRREDGLTAPLRESPWTHSPQGQQRCPPAADCLRRTTWHLFTSYVQQYFTAFPTALVHRYHLHHLAPSLFPIMGLKALTQRAGDLGGVGEGCAAGRAAVSAQAPGSDEAAHAQRAKPNALCSSSACADDSVEYWPYSLKLRCIPDAALQLPSKNQGMKKKAVQETQGAEMEGSLQRGSSTVQFFSGLDVVPTTDSSTSRKRVRRSSPSRDDASAPACAAHATLNSLPRSVETSCVLPRSVSARTPPPPPPPPPPSPAPPRRIAVVDGVSSLLPYPTPASALSLLSASFLRLLKTDSTSSTAPTAGEAPVMTSTSTEGHKERDDCDAAPRASVDAFCIGVSDSGGGALGFLGTGSAVPSKYRNVSGSFLELYLPAYCFPGGERTAHRPFREDDGVHASGAGVGEETYTPLPTHASLSTDETSCAWRAVDDLRCAEPVTSLKRSCSSTMTRVVHSHATVSPQVLSAPSRTASHQLRRGVIILDFGEGSAGQLASLCRRVRCGSSCNNTRSCNTWSTSPLCGALDRHQESTREEDQREGLRSDPAVDPKGSASSPYIAPGAILTESDDDDDDGADLRLARFVLDIVLVFISHAHADHHLGLMTLLTLRHEYLQRAECAPQSVPRLLVVCPTEVYAFMTDTWGNTEPYATWLHDECLFELMPPPVNHLRGEGLLSKVVETAEDDVAPREVEERRQALTAVEGDTIYDAVGDLEPDHNGVDDGVVDSTRAASVTHRCQRHNRQALHTRSVYPEEQHVVPMPLLQAHLSAWNQAIEVGIQHHQRQCLSSSFSLPASFEAHAGASMVADCRVGGDAATAQPTGNAWWNAEVITVDHPANAHALLLRFPSFLPLNNGQSDRGVCGEVAEDGATFAVRADVAKASTGGMSVAQRLSRVPDTSRVLLFSGDTRPSSFLVERSRAFTASAQSRLPTCVADSTELPARSRLTADESATGNAFEEGRATFMARGNGGSSSGGVQAGPSGRRSTSPPPPPTLAPAPSPPPPPPPPPVFILLHEATFGPGFEAEAIRKKHSTLPEALRIGAAVRAEFVVLNHFSQRYPKLPGLSEEQLCGRSTDLVCQRRTRAPAAAAAVSSAVDHTVSESPAHLVGDRVGDEGAPGPRSLNEQQGLSGRVSLRAQREDGGLNRSRRDTEQQEGAGQPLVPPPAVTSDVTASPYPNMSFAFDLMMISFRDMQRGLVPRLTPTLVRLLEEYDSWGISTTQRMRSGSGRPTEAATKELVRRPTRDGCRSEGH